LESNFLYKILKSLNEKEFRDFGKFINSPFHNNRSEICRFYDAIKKSYPEFKSDEIQNEKLFKKIYPGKKFSGVLYRKIMSLTSNLALEYLNIDSFKNNKLDFNVKLLYLLYDRNLSDAFRKKSVQIEKLLDESFHHAEYYELRFKYTSKLNGYLSDKVNIPDYQKEIDEFIEEFIVIIFHLYHRLLVTQNIVNVSFNLRFYDSVFEFLKSFDFSNNTLISLYYNLVNLTKTQDEKYFYELIKVQEKFYKKLTPLYLYNVFVTLADFSMNKISKGDIKYKKIYFDLTKKYFKDFKTKIETGYLNPVLFSSIVRNAASLKEFEWVESFISAYSVQLEPDQIEESLNYAYADVEFSKGNFEKSLEYIYKVNPVKVSMKINSKKIQIMNFFELGYHIELNSLLDSFKHFFHREKSIGETLRKRNLPFIKYISELNHFIIKDDVEGVELLFKKIDKTEYFVQKEWIKRKITEFLNKKKKKYSLNKKPGYVLQPGSYN